MAGRYSRQERFAPLGAEGQRRLRSARALVVGVGALGTHVAEALARAGVGELILVDRDVVTEDNLPRQVLFDEDDAEHGRPKAVAAARRLACIDRSARITAHAAEFDTELYAALERPDVIVDGTDNFSTRYLLNDLAVRDSIPWVYGGAVGGEGRASVIVPGSTPCLRCLWPTPPPSGETPTCETAGVVAPVVAQVAAFQAIEAIKLLVGAADAVTRGVWVVDVWHHRTALGFAKAGPRPGCETCGTRAFPALAAGRPRAVELCGRDAVQIRPGTPTHVDLRRLAANLATGAEHVELTAHLLRFDAEGCRFSVFADGRALVFAAGTARHAKALYDRYVGAG